MRKPILKILVNIVLALTVSISVSVNAADSYQYSVGALYDNMEDDNNFETTLLLGGVAYYFKPVSYGNGPYSEAEFLDRQSRITGAYGQAEFKESGESVEGPAITLEYKFAEKSTPLTFDVAYINFDIDDTVVGNNVEIKFDSWQFNVGYYLTNRSVVGVAITNIDSKIKYNGVLQGEAKADIIGVNYRVLNFLGGNTFVALEAGIDRIEDDDNNTNNEVSLIADYYVDRSTGLHAGFTINSGDDSFSEGKATEFGVNYFISPETGLSFQLSKFSADKDGIDDDTLTIEFEHRFN